MLGDLRRKLGLARGRGDHPLFVAAARLARLGKRVERRARRFLRARDARLPRRRDRSAPQRRSPAPPRCRPEQHAPPIREDRRIVGHAGDLDVERGEPLFQLGDALARRGVMRDAQRSRSVAMSASRRSRIVSSCAARSASSRVSAARPRASARSACTSSRRRSSSAVSDRPSRMAASAARELRPPGLRVGLDPRQRAGMRGKPLGDLAVPALGLAQAPCGAISSVSRASCTARRASTVSRSASARTCVALPRMSSALSTAGAGGLQLLRHDCEASRAAPAGARRRRRSRASP